MHTYSASVFLVYVLFRLIYEAFNYNPYYVRCQWRLVWYPLDDVLYKTHYIPAISWNNLIIPVITINANIKYPHTRDSNTLRRIPPGVNVLIFLSVSARILSTGNPLPFVILTHASITPTT